MRIDRYADLWSTVADDHILIAVNERLARHLWSSRLAARSEKTYPAGQIQSLQGWLSGLWEHIAMLPSVPQLLTTVQRKLIWSRIIREDADHGCLFSDQMAGLAIDAWDIMHLWQLSTELMTPTAFEAPELAVFRRFAQAYSQMLSSLHACDNVMRYSILQAHLSHLRGALPSEVTLVGFDDRPPALLALFDLAGIVVRWFETAENMAAMRLQVAHDDQTELMEAIAWGRDYVVDHPQQRCAIVVPDLHTVRDQVVRTAIQLFHPDLWYTEHSAQDYAFTVSGGVPLARVSVVDEALLLWRLFQSGDAVLFSRLCRLQSIVGSQSERDARAYLSAELMSQGDRLTTLSSLRDWLVAAECVPILVDAFDAALAIQQPMSGSLSDWQAYFLALLDCFQWPGDDALTSETYQAVDAFYEALPIWLAGNAFEEAWHGAAAYDALYQILIHTAFQSESNQASRCDILGHLEAVGLSYDAIWVMGQREDCFPARPKPNPFIPYHLSVSRGLPHGSIQREYTFALSLLSQLAGQCQELVLSYAAFSADQAKAPSPIISQIAPHVFLGEDAPITPPKLLPVDHPVPAAWCYHGPPDVRPKSAYGPPVLDSQVSGGVWVLASQAQCPFQAFARYRLCASDLPDQQMFIDARIQGGMLHDILAALWQTLQSSDRLHQLDAADEAQLIDRHVSRTLATWQARYPRLLTAPWMQQEQSRLTMRVAAHLAAERERPDFEVCAFETTYFGELAGLGFSMRVDRVDRDAQGQRIVIDYKTGQANIRAWFETPLLAPQMPLYLLLTEAQLGMFHIIRQAQTAYVGVAAAKSEIPGVLTLDKVPGGFQSWSELTLHWQVTLQETAEAYRSGYAAVAPVKPQQTCRYCDLGRLCRIKSQQRQQVIEA